MENKKWGEIMNRKNIIHLEVIRIIALFCIVYNHIGYTLFLNTNNQVEIVVSIVLSVLCKVGVPLFFMISGALLLGKEESWETVYKKRVLRIAAVIVIFTVIRFLYECYIAKAMEFSVVYLVKAVLTGNILHPYWFLYAYLSILLILPILRIVVKNLDFQGKKCLLALIILFYMIIPLKALVVNQEWLVTLMLDEKICYLFLGYFIEREMEEKHFSRKNKLVAWLGAIAAIAVSFGMVVKPHAYGGEYALEYLSVMSMPLACAIFYLIRSASFGNESRNPTVKNLIVQVGNCVFGVYLIEDYLRKIVAIVCEGFGYYTDRLSVCIFRTVIVVLLGVPVIYALKKLPILKKLL